MENAWGSFDSRATRSRTVTDLMVNEMYIVDIALYPAFGQAVRLAVRKGWLGMGTTMFVYQPDPCQQDISDLRLE
jgi:hypothetical protein